MSSNSVIICESTPVGGSLPIVFVFNKILAMFISSDLLNTYRKGSHLTPLDPYPALFRNPPKFERLSKQHYDSFMRIMKWGSVSKNDFLTLLGVLKTQFPTGWQLLTYPERNRE